MRFAGFMCLCGAGFVVCQDIHWGFSPSMWTWSNPAFATLMDAYYHIGISVRKQYTGIGDGYFTGGLVVDGSIISFMERRAKGGGSLFVITDRSAQGALQNTLFGVCASTSLTLGMKHAVAIGLGATAFNVGFSPERLQWGSQYDGTSYNPSLPSGENISGESRWFLDPSVGIGYRYGEEQETFYSKDRIYLAGGLSIQHVTTPHYYTAGSSEKRATVGVFLNFKYPLVAGMLNVGGFSHYMKVGPHQQILFAGELGFIFSSEGKILPSRNPASISIGAGYRHPDAPLFFIKGQYSFLSIGLMYEHASLTKGNVPGFATFELVIEYSRKKGATWEHLKQNKIL